MRERGRVGLFRAAHMRGCRLLPPTMRWQAEAHRRLLQRIFTAGTRPLRAPLATATYGPLLAKRCFSHGAAPARPLPYSPVEVVEEARQPPHHELVVAPPLVQLAQQRLVAVLAQGRQHLGRTLCMRDETKVG